MATSEEPNSASVAGSSQNVTAGALSNAFLTDSLKLEAEDGDTASTGTPRDSLDGTLRKGRPRDRGLDGGYWSQLNTLEETGRKRQRTDRLDLSAEFTGHEKTTRRSNSLESISSSSKASKSRRDKSCVLFKRKSFIAVLNEQNSFYLCQTVESVYEHSKKSKIQWLEEIEPNKYKYGIVDWVEPYSIISRVKCRRVPRKAGQADLVEIVEKDLEKVQDLVQKAVTEGGITVDFDEVAGDTDSDESIVGFERNNFLYY